MHAARIVIVGGLSLALSGISVLCCFVFGTHLAAGNEGQLYGVLGGVADALKAVLPLAIAAALAAGQKPRAAAGAAMFAVFTLYSFTSEIGLYARSRSAVASDAQAGKEGYEAVKAERARIAARLKELGAQRPAGAVRGDIAAAKQQRLWETSRQCEAPAWSAERTFCAAAEKLQGELAGAEEAERLRGQDGALAQKQAGFDLAAVMRSTDPQSEALARFTGFSAASVRDALAVLVAVLIELGSGLGLWVAASGADHSAAKQMQGDGKERPSETAATGLPVASGDDGICIEGPGRDPVAAFVRACCQKRAAGEATAADLHAAFRLWAAGEGAEAISAKALGQRLANLGFQRCKRGGVVRYSGLAIRGA